MQCNIRLIKFILSYLPQWRTPRLAALGLRGENQPADKGCNMVYNQEKYYCLYFRWWRAWKHTAGGWRVWVMFLGFNKQWISVFVYIETLTYAGRSWAKMTLKHFIATIGRTSANTNSPTVPDVCCIIKQTQQSTLATWWQCSSVGLLCTHWNHTIVGHFLWSLS